MIITINWDVSRLVIGVDMFGAAGLFIVERLEICEQGRALVFVSRQIYGIKVVEFSCLWL